MSLLQTPPATSISTTAVDVLIEEVAGLVGGPDEPDVRELAIRCLDRAADRLNMQSIWMHRRKEATFTSFTDGQSTLTLPSDWGWPDRPVFAYDSDGNQVAHIDWVTWDMMRAAIQTTDTTQQRSVPNYISIRTVMDELLYLFPYINTGSLATIIVPYFTRVLRISEVSDGSLYITKEAREALLTTAQFLIMQRRHAAKPAIWGPWREDAIIAVTLARGAAAREEGMMRPAAAPSEVGFYPSGGTFDPAPLPRV